MSLGLYTENILDLYKNPRNKGILKNPTHEFFKNNPLCGDEVALQFIVEDGKVTNIKFNGVGCAISMASASMLTDKIKNLTMTEIKKITKDDILDMLHIPISLARLKCALLPLDVLRGALENGP